MSETLPKGWISTELGQIVLHRKGKKPKSTIQTPKNGYVPYLLIDEMEGKPIRSYTDDKTVPVAKGEDILIVWDGSIGKTATGLSGAIGSTIAALTPIIIPSNFLETFLKLSKPTIEQTSRGTGLQHINQTTFWPLSFPLPPLNEQNRIVAKLDKIMPRIDAVKERLDKVPVIVKRFRQSVLTAAVTGKLTEKWRAEHPDAEHAEDGNSLDDTGIPISWKNVQIECLVKSLKNDLRTGPFGTSLKKSEHQKTGVPVWGIESIGENGKFTNYNKIFVSEEKAKELKSFTVEGGDIVISRSGTVGELCILPDNIPLSLISTNLLKISLDKTVIIPRFFCFLFVGSPELLDKMRELCSGSTRLFLTQKILRNLDFPLPPLEEQKEIVRQVDKLFALADRLESHYQKAKGRVDKLSQSVLAKAFRGELVITEAELAQKEGRDFESAGKLLERILEEKAKLVGSKNCGLPTERWKRK